MTNVTPDQVLATITARGPRGSFTFAPNMAGRTSAREFRAWAADRGLAVSTVRNACGIIVSLEVAK